MTHLAALLLFLLALEGDATRIRGSWHHDEHGGKIKYLTKFGVQRDHEIFAYGTCARTGKNFVSLHDKLALVFVPQSVWDAFYSRERRKDSCEDFMSSPFNRSVAPDDRCSDPGDQDYFRVVPCDHRGACQNQPVYVPLVVGSSFTFRVNSTDTQYYYMALVGCLQNTSSTRPCDWARSDSFGVRYDIHIVNSDPDPFVYEFPYNHIGLAVVYIVFSFVYLALLIFHLAMYSPVCTPRGYKHHRLPALFTFSLVLEFLHVALVMTHYSVFSVDGVGVKPLLYMGQVANFISDWLLILVLILIGKGWQVTIATVRWKKTTTVIWLLYIVVSAVFFAWTVVQETVFPFSAERVDTYHTWAGGLFVAYRFLLLFYILYELRQIYLIENRDLKLVLYRCLLLLYLLWFGYLVVAVIVARILNPLERERVIAVSVLTFDLLTNVAMVLLFCPKWSNQYFQFNSHLNYLTQVRMTRMRYNSTSSRSSLTV